MNAQRVDKVERLRLEVLEERPLHSAALIEAHLYAGRFEAHLPDGGLLQGSMIVIRSTALLASLPALGIAERPSQISHRAPTGAVQLAIVSQEGNRFTATATLQSLDGKLVEVRLQGAAHDDGEIVLTGSAPGVLLRIAAQLIANTEVNGARRTVEYTLRFSCRDLPGDHHACGRGRTE
jgi:hypothetical protein